MMTDILLDYAECHTTPEHPLLAKLNRETHLSQVYPQMLSGHVQGTFLRMIVQMISPKRVLEIGTFTGYSAIAMGLGLMPAGKPVSQAVHPWEQGKAILHTIEVNPELEDGIQKFIHEAGLEEVIRLHIGSALEIIPTLREAWDLVFIDADKPNYLNYYKMVLPMVRPGGFIIADNVLWDGKVTGDPSKMDKDTQGIVEFNEFVCSDERVEQMIVTIRDGLMVVRKK
ncbi:MAG: O-methyltransferase [Bacteroidales bacterium]